MGRIKTLQVKRTTRKIMEFHGDILTDDFEKNKLIVDEIAEISSKKLRNVIAGYLTRIKRNPGSRPKKTESHIDEYYTDK